MTLTFTVDRQSITRTDTQQVVANSISYLRAQFAFLNDWDTDHILTPLFQNGTRVYTPVLLDTGRYLDADNICIIPQEALTETGTLYVSIFDETDGVRITTDRAAVPIERSGYTQEAEESLTPTPSAYEQIMADYADFKQTGLKKDGTDLTLSDGKLQLTAGGEPFGTGAVLPKTMKVSEFESSEIAAVTDGQYIAGWGILAGTYDTKTQAFSWNDTYVRLPEAMLPPSRDVLLTFAYDTDMALLTEDEEGKLMLDKAIMSVMASEVGKALTEQNTMEVVNAQYMAFQQIKNGDIYDIYLFSGIALGGLSSTATLITNAFYEAMQIAMAGAKKASISFIPLEEEETE